MISVIGASRFTRHLWLTLGMYIILAVAFAIYVNVDKRIETANALRLQSYLLTDELRQSTDNLTRMARAYISTGDPIYKQRHQDILDIRNGNKAWPLGYQHIYRDMASPPRADNTQQIALLELVRKAGFTAQEYKQLAQAKTASDTLAQIDMTAMKMIASGMPRDQATQFEAMKLLQSDAYFQANSALILSIDETQTMMGQRTLTMVRQAEATASRLRLVFIFLNFSLLYLLWRTYRTLRTTLGGSVDKLYDHIASLGNGDFSQLIDTTPGMKNSVLGWLSETQLKLIKLHKERDVAEEHLLRLSKLYEALSQCNQVIVRCNSDTELFQQICRVAVQFGGMKMAWIGMINQVTERVVPIASYGDGVEYLENITITISSNDPFGHGPVGTAIRENQASWCQDFQHDPNTAPWHDRGAVFGWGAVAALPMHCDGRLMGVFTMYSTEPYAFDEAAQNLLTEMMMDIEFALEGFARMAEQRHAQEMEAERIFMLERITSDATLQTIMEDIVLRLESLKPEAFCSILLLSEDGQHLRLGAAPSLPDYFNSAIEGERIGEGAGSCGNAAFTGKRTIVEDINHHPYWVNYLPLAQKVGLRACWSEPIMSADNRVIGTFAIYHRTPALPTPHDTQLIEMAAHFIAIAIERKQAEAHIHQLVHYDPLTRLPNRLLLEKRAHLAINLAQRTGTQLAVLFFDLDHFKNINDNLGHRIGDELLITLAQRLQSVLRDEDTVSRLGGDEFIFVLPNTDIDDAAHVAEKLLYVVSQPYHLDNHELTITTSIGIAMYPEDGADFDTLIKAADVAMYRAKQAGRNGHCYFTHEMQIRSARNLLLENALRRALERNQLFIEYQPQISLKTGKIIGAEALVRWHNPELGLISPTEFIPLAEDSGQIFAIGEWVLRTAIRQLKAWMDADLAPITMAVNLSAVQFRHARLPELVTSILNESDLSPQLLELELTESVAMDDPLTAIAVMNDLHTRGVRMSIDDFGTGYSSLNYLKKFKVYKLKIDQSFVHDISTDPEDKAIVAAIISMAHSLGFQTIAEGVETEGQLSFLRAQGCNEVQGYYFSKPLAADQFELFVRNWQPY